MSIRALSFTLTAVAAVLLALALTLAGLFLHALALALTAGLWAYWFHRQNAKSAALGFGMIGAFAILGGFASIDGTGVQLNFYLLLSSVLLVLAGYDLADLHSLLQKLGEHESEQSSRVRQHYIRLGLVLFVGLIMGILGFNWQLSLSFGWIVSLALFGTLGLGIMVRFLLNGQE
ncbi:MAG: hypothetical protein R6W69_05270 [Anaerolineales bacterium]